MRQPPDRPITLRDWTELIEWHAPVGMSVEDLASVLLFNDWDITKPRPIPIHRGNVVKPSTDGYGERKQFGCPTCGNLFLLPWSQEYDPPWCIHNGSSGYAWPETHWQGGEERDPDWRERWKQNGWSEMYPVVAVKAHPCPIEDRCALNRGAQECKHCERTWPLT